MGRLTIAAGFVLLYGCMAVAIYFGVVPGFDSLAYVVWPVFIALSVSVIMLGQRMLAVGADELLGQDPRPPVMYL